MTSVCPRQNRHFEVTGGDETWRLDILLRIFDDHRSWETPVLLNLKMEGSLAKMN